MAKLVLLSAGMTGRTHDLKAEKTTVGRVEDNTFQIAEPSVSSHHCEILLRGKQFGGEIEAVGRDRGQVGQRNQTAGIGQARGHRRQRVCKSASRVQRQALALHDRLNQLLAELLGGLENVDIGG